MKLRKIIAFTFLVFFYGETVKAKIFISLGDRIRNVKKHAMNDCFGWMKI